MRKRRAGTGFTLAEIMISISILSIGILGTLSMIAYGVRTSTIGKDSSQAMEVSRRILEILLEGGSARGVKGGAAGQYGLELITGSPPSATQYAGNWQQLLTDANAQPLPVIHGPFELSDFIDPTDRAQVEAFREAAQKYEYNIVRSRYTTDASKAEYGLWNVTVEVRWTEKGTNIGVRDALGQHGNKSVTTQGMYRAL